MEDLNVRMAKEQEYTLHKRDLDAAVEKGYVESAFIAECIPGGSFRVTSLCLGYGGTGPCRSPH